MLAAKSVDTQGSAKKSVSRGLNPSESAIAQACQLSVSSVL
ncbi:hypothetical protein [Coleofasciculus sp. H7-2]